MQYLAILLPSNNSFSSKQRALRRIHVFKGNHRGIETDKPHYNEQQALSKPSTGKTTKFPFKQVVEVGFGNGGH